MELILLVVWSPAILYGLGKVTLAVGKLSEISSNAKKIKL